MASQSRLNVNSVFSYMRLTPSDYYATDEENDEMTNARTMTNHSFVIRHSTFVLRHLIHILLVTFLVLELLNVCVGFLDVFAALFANYCAQRRIDILGHPPRIATHKKVRTLVFDPLPNFGGIFHHFVLNVDFLRLIA